MTTVLDKTLKRVLEIDGRSFVVAISPDGLKMTLKGRRRGRELKWADLVSGEAALAVALNASLGEFAQNATPAPRAAARAPPPDQPVAKSRKKSRRAKGSASV